MKKLLIIILISLIAPIFAGPGGSGGGLTMSPTANVMQDLIIVSPKINDIFYDRNQVFVDALKAVSIEQGMTSKAVDLSKMEFTLDQDNKIIISDPNAVSAIEFIDGTESYYPSLLDSFNSSNIQNVQMSNGLTLEFKPAFKK